MIVPTVTEKEVLQSLQWCLWQWTPVRPDPQYGCIGVPFQRAYSRCL